MVQNTVGLRGGLISATTLDIIKISIKVHQFRRKNHQNNTTSGAKQAEYFGIISRSQGSTKYIWSTSKVPTCTGVPSVRRVDWFWCVFKQVTCRMCANLNLNVVLGGNRAKGWHWEFLSTTSPLKEFTKKKKKCKSNLNRSHKTPKWPNTWTTFHWESWIRSRSIWYVHCMKLQRSHVTSRKLMIGNSLKRSFQVFSRLCHALPNQHLSTNRSLNLEALPRCKLTSLSQPKWRLRAAVDRLPNNQSTTQAASAVNIGFLSPVAFRFCAVGNYPRWATFYPRKPP